LEELAERRFLAAQNPEVPTTNIPSSDELQFQVNALSEKTAFQDLFKKVAHADFSSYLAKLQTPREAMIMMSAICERLEANPEKGLEAQDMEIAVGRAMEQAV